MSFRSPDMVSGGVFLAHSFETDGLGSGMVPGSQP